jgi:hypothetical protein
MAEYNRRSSDKLDRDPTPRELQEQIDQLTAVVSSMQDAFLTNDLGKKDYEGHRLDHLHRKKIGENISNMKLTGAMKLVGIMTALIFGIFASGLSAHLQKLFGN